MSSLVVPVSCPLSKTNSRAEIVERLPTILGPLVAFDALDVRFEPGVEIGCTPGECRIPFVWRNGEGSLTVRRNSGEFSTGEKLIFRLIAEQIAATLTLQESRQELARAELVLSINNSIAANLDLDALLRSIVQTLRRTLACDFVSITMGHPEAGYMQSLVLDFPEGRGVFQEGSRLPIDNSMLGQVFTSRKRMLIRNLDEMDPADAVRSRAAAEGIVVGCFCPLVHQDHALGVMTAGWRQPDNYTDEAGEILDAVAAQVAIALDNAMAYQRISELKDQLAQEKLYLEDEIRGEFNFSEIVGNAPALRRVLKQVETVAPTDSSVLIYGETGSGKELIARAIHDLSARRGSTFVKLNCAAIPSGLLESELFGHERGAFTGAVAQRIGRFELANRGTIFLDEVGEIPLELQPKLLRVLQEREFERLGSSRTLRSDARLIAATNRDLDAMVENREYRADLYYRLNVFPIHLPPLRERPEDIPVLVRYFVQQSARRMNRTIDTIPAESMNALRRYPWPGNIRELQNLIERAVILSPGPVLRVPVEGLKIKTPLLENDGSKTLAGAERAHILTVLNETNWVLAGANGAAAKLGMNRSTLRFRMSKLGIERPR